MRCAVRHWRNRPGVGVLPALVRPSGTSTYMCARARLGLRLYIKVTCALGSGLVRDGALVLYVIVFFIYNLYNLKNDPKSESSTDTHCGHAPHWRRAAYGYAPGGPAHPSRRSTISTSTGPATPQLQAATATLLRYQIKLSSSRRCCLHAPRRRRLLALPAHNPCTAGR